MLTRLVYPNCDSARHLGLPAIDAFWVEATPAEARRLVFPLLTSEAQAEARECSRRLPRSGVRGCRTRPFCFLVARDLSFVLPFWPAFPFAGMWNAWNPFRAFPRRKIASLSELTTIPCPRPTPGSAIGTIGDVDVTPSE